MFHERLKLERERLNISQTAFGESCGVRKQAQINYEKGERQPDSDYLQKAYELGVDIGYLFSGQRTNVDVAPNDEKLLLDAFRAVPTLEKPMILKFLLSGISGFK